MAKVVVGAGVVRDFRVLRALRRYAEENAEVLVGESSRLGATAVVCDFNDANGGLVVEVTLVSISCDEAARRNAGILLRPLLLDAFLLRALPSPDNCCKRASLLPRTVCFFRAACVLIESWVSGEDDATVPSSHKES